MIKMNILITGTIRIYLPDNNDDDDDGTDNDDNNNSNTNNNDNKNDNHFKYLIFFAWG